MTDFSTILNGLSGEPFKVGSNPLRLADVAIEALLSPNISDNWKGKVRRFALAKRITEGMRDSAGLMTLSPDEKRMLKGAIGLFCGPAIVGAVWQTVGDL